MAADTLHNAPVVLDNGSGTIRAGFAGEDSPKCFFPSWVGRPKHTRVLAGALEGEVFIGQKAATELRGLLKIRHPLEHGIVTDWDDMERIWEYVWGEGLKTLSEEHPVLLTEPPLNPRSNRDTAAQILFETFNVPAIHTSIQAVLSLYASGRTTGIVLDSGDGVSHAVPVFEGFAMPNSIQRIDIAGRDVTEYLQQLLRKSGYVFNTSAEKEVVRLMKESLSWVTPDPKREEKMWAGGKHPEGKVGEYVLPDGRKIKLGTERFRAPEILFNPELIGSEYPGVHQIVVDAITRTDLDLRKSLYSNIVLSGGSTLTKGFGDRLLTELQRLAVKDMRIKIFAPPERKYSTWIGGSILAGLSTFRKMWVSVDDWHENPDIIHTKFA
ncbi:actin domain-containing protein [Sarocladium implicatum]|nr:actin domain-containing protein [Sarocladium implicatum]